MNFKHYNNYTECDTTNWTLLASLLDISSNLQNRNL